jgi:uncharacterized membrane protein
MLLRMNDSSVNGIHFKEEKCIFEGVVLSAFKIALLRVRFCIFNIRLVQHDHIAFPYSNLGFITTIIIDLSLFLSQIGTDMF